MKEPDGAFDLLNLAGHVLLVHVLVLGRVDVAFFGGLRRDDVGHSGGDMMLLVR